MRKLLSLALVLTMVLSTIAMMPLSASAEEITDALWRTLPYGEAFDAFLGTAGAAHNNGYGAAKDEIKNINFVNNSVIYNGSKLFNHLTSNFGVPFNSMQTKTFALSGTDVKYYKQVGTIWRKGTNSTVDSVNHIGEITVTYSDGATNAVIGHGYTHTNNGLQDVDTLGYIDGDRIEPYSSDNAHYITKSDASGHDSTYYPLTKIEARSHNSLLHALIGVQYSINELKDTVLPAIIDDLTAKKAGGADITDEYIALQNTITSANSRVGNYDIVLELSEELQAKYAELSIDYSYATLIDIEKNGRILIKDGVNTTPIYAGNKNAIGVASLNSLHTALNADATNKKVGDSTVRVVKRTDNGNAVEFNIDGLLPTLSQATGTHYDSEMLFTSERTFNLSGKYLKGVAFVGATHALPQYPQHIDAKFVSVDNIEYPAGDLEIEVPIYHCSANTNPFVTGVTSDGTNATTDPYYLNYSVAYNDTVTPIAAKKIDVDLTESTGSWSGLQLVGLYEIEYSFPELTTVMTKVINSESAQTIAAAKRNSIRATIESAELRGYDAKASLGEEVYAKYLEICPDAKAFAYATAVPFEKDARVLLKDEVQTTPAGTNYERFGIASLNSLLNEVDIHKKEYTIALENVSVIERTYDGNKIWFNTKGLFPTLSEATGENFDSAVIWTKNKTFNLSGKYLKGVAVLGVNHYNVANTQFFASKLSSITGKTTGFEKIESYHSTHTTKTFISGVTTTESGTPTSTAYNVGLTTHYNDALNPIPVSFMELDMSGTVMDDLTTTSALNILAIYEIEYSVNELKDTVIPNIVNNVADNKENMTDAEIALIADALEKTINSAKGRGFELTMLTSDVLAKYKEICPEIPESDTLKVTGSTPSNGAREVSKETTDIIIEFSNLLDETLTSDKITVKANNVNLGKTTVVARNKILLSLNNALGANKTVTVTVDAGVKDIYGNQTAEKMSFTFETEYKESSIKVLFEDDFETSADLNNWISSNANTPLEIVNDPFGASNKVLKFKANLKDGGTASFTRPFTDVEDFAGSIAVTFRYAWGDDGSNTDWGYMPRFMTLKDTNSYYNAYMGAGGHGVVRIYGTTKEADGEGATVDTRMQPILKWQKMTYIINLSANTISYSIDGGAYETRYFTSVPSYNNIYKELMIDLGQSSSETDSAVFYLDDVKLERIPGITVLSNYGETLNPVEDIAYTLNMPLATLDVTIKNSKGDTIVEGGRLSDDRQTVTVPVKGNLDYNETYTINYNFVSVYGTSKSSQVVISTPKAKSVNFVDAITVTPNASKTEFTASFTITNPESSPKDVWVVLAAYNGNNKMLKIISQSYLAPVGTYTPEIPLVLSGVPSGTTVVRAFMWDSPETLNAYQMPIEFNIQ